MSKKTRAEQRAAEVHLFTQLVEVCMQHRAVWCTHALSNQAMAAFSNSVELLGKVQHMREAAPPPQRISERELELPRLRVRLAELYTLLHTQPTVPHSWEVGMLAIPARTALPTDTNALVELADQVYQTLLHAPAQCAAVGIKPHKLIQFKASLKRCTPHKGIVRHNNNSIGTYDRQLNSCLRHLVERVDPVMIRFAEHKAFSTAYKAARRPLLKLEVAARRNVKRP